ncbi:MAG: S9 family peptidase [candidate division Zixibacteria bacterium]|nr:S9 family peptidase [candidate division Zixibacteria bacterium]
MKIQHKFITAFCILLIMTGTSNLFAQTDRASTQATTTPDIATFLQVGYAKPCGYSWDGTGVYFGTSMSGAPQAYRLNEHGWPYQLTTFEDGIDTHSGAPYFELSWGGDMAIVGASIGGSELSQLFLMDTQTGSLRQLTFKPNARYRTVLWAKDDRSIIYNSSEENGRDFHIYRMDIESGEAIKIFGDSITMPGAKYPTRFSQDGRKLIVDLTHSNADIDLFLLDLLSGEWQKLTEDTINVIYDSPTLMPDNEMIYLICDNNDDGILRLATMMVGSPAVQFIDDGWLDPRWEVKRLTFSRDYKYMCALVNEDGYMRLKIRETESKKELPSPPLEGQIGGGFIDQTGRCLISFENPTRPSDVWRWDPLNETLEQLTFSTYASIDPKTLIEPELVHFTSFDDLEIPAYLYLPAEYVPGTPVPFIVYAHGGPTGQSVPRWIGTFQYLIQNGYGILAVNPRGSTGYGRAFTALDDYHNRKNSLKDYKASVDWLIAEGYTAKGMIGIRGGSYGGYVVLGMITEYPDLFAAAMNSVGIANFETFLQNTQAYRRKNREAEYGPLSDPEFLREISPIHKADQIRTPLFVIHGENDSRVPVGEARQVIKAVLNNGGVVDSLIFPDEGHGARKLSNKITMYRKMVEFFDTHLKKPVENPAIIEN